MKGLVGRIVIWCCLLVTINLFILAKMSVGEEVRLSWLSLSQLLSLLGTVLLSISFLLSARFRFVEDWFSGLDGVYVSHKWVGIAAFLTLLHHPIFLAVAALPSVELGRRYFWFGDNWSYNFGLGALFLMILLLILTMLIRLPYSIWKKTHETIGLVLLLAAIHILTIKSDISVYWPLRSWLILFLIGAGYSVVYRRFLYRYFGPKYRYAVDEVSRVGDVLLIWLRPLTKRIQFQAGQFVFLRVDKLGAEEHPFSLAGDPNDQRIMVGVKILGDFTLRLRDLTQGDAVTVMGPFGRFGVNENEKKDLIWVAGGIGITPFLSLLYGEVRSPADRKVDIFYCVKNESEAFCADRITEVLRGVERVKYWQHFSEGDGRLEARLILSKVGDLLNRKIMLCGPLAMMEGLRSQFVKLGVRRKDIIFEDFNFR
jgi:predicted ferric reductase